MLKNILVMVALCMGTEGSATDIIKLKMTKEQCKAACSPAKCTTVSGQQTCFANCENQIDTEPCTKVAAFPEDLSEANTAAGIKKAMFTKKLLKQKPDAAYYLNSGDVKLKKATEEPTLEDYSHVNYVLTNLRGMCARTITEYLNISKGKDKKLKDQFLHMIGALDHILKEIKEPYKPSPDNPIRTNMMLKHKVGDAELLIKNCIQQGSGAIFSFKNKTSQKIKGFITAPFTCRSCTSDNCSKKLDIYKKCVEKCPKKYRTKCINNSNQAMEDSYQKEMEDSYQKEFNERRF